MRIRFIAIALLTLLGAPFAASGQNAAGPPSRPNIVWISNEDMSPRLGAYGDRVARTPVLDRLASESIRYTHAFSSAPVCAPSRAAIITGMHQSAIGAQHMRTTENGVPELPGPYLAVPPFYVKAFPEYLRAAGYFTTNRAKTDYQFGVPFTIWDDLGASAHWRNRRDRSQPFFSVFNLEITHESRVFPGSATRKGKPPVTSPASVAVPPYYPDTPVVREDLAYLYDNIAAMDAQVGEILRQLQEDGLADNTIVVYWSDHGDGIPRSKRSLYDSGLRVPLMIRMPASIGGAKRGATIDDLVSLIDLAPTMLSLAGVTVPAHMQGRVLLGRDAALAPAYVFAARDRMDAEYDMMRSARDARFLYIRNFQPELPYAGLIVYRNQSAIMQELLRLHAAGKLSGDQTLWLRTSRPAEELFDVGADPHQVRDLAREPAHRATLERMRAAVQDWMTRIGDQGLINEAEMIQRMWPGGIQPVTAQPYVADRRSTSVADARRLDRDRRADGDRGLRPDPGRVDRIHDRRWAGRRLAALHRPDSRHRRDDAARQGHPLRLPGKRRNKGCVDAEGTARTVTMSFRRGVASVGRGGRQRRILRRVSRLLFVNLITENGGRHEGCRRHDRRARYCGVRPGLLTDDAGSDLEGEDQRQQLQGEAPGRRARRQEDDRRRLHDGVRQEGREVRLRVGRQGLPVGEPDLEADRDPRRSRGRDDGHDQGRRHHRDADQDAACEVTVPVVRLGGCPVVR